MSAPGQQPGSPGTKDPKSPSEPNEPESDPDQGSPKSPSFQSIMSTKHVTIHETLEANRAYFSELAQSYDQRHKGVIERLVTEIRERKDFIGANWVKDDESGEPRLPVRLLDYACGTGLATMALAEYTTQCIGIDSAAGMVAAYNARAVNQGLSRDEMQGFQGDFTVELTDQPAGFASPEFWDFDIAIVALGFHHFENIHLAVNRLVQRLRTGGVLVIVDFLTHPPANGPGSHTVKHHGFSREQVEELFQVTGGLVGFRLEVMGSGMVFRNNKREGHQWKRDLFIARGVKV